MKLNILGLLLYFPLLLATAMSFDAGPLQTWTHLFFVIAHILLGPLCLISILSASRPNYGFFGFILVGVSWVLFGLAG